MGTRNFLDQARERERVRGGGEEVNQIERRSVSRYDKEKNEIKLVVVGRYINLRTGEGR